MNSYTYTDNDRRQITVTYTERTYEIIEVGVVCLVEGCGRMACWRSPMHFGLHLRPNQKPLLRLSVCPHAPMFTLEYGRGQCPPWFTQAEKVAWILS